MSIAAALHADRSRTPRAASEDPATPVGPLISGIVTTTCGAHGQPVHLHRHAYRTTHPDDAAWTAHGYAWRCPTCHTIGAHDQYTPTLHSAEAHTCPKGGAR